MQTINTDQTSSLGQGRNSLSASNVISSAEPVRKQRVALISIVLLVVLGVIGTSLSLAAYTYTDNLKVGAFWSQVAIVLGCIPLLIGVCFKQHGKPWMTAGLVLTPIATIMTFIGAVIDALYAAHIAETDFGECGYREWSKDGRAQCGAIDMILWDMNCDFEVGRRSCYCCYLVKQSDCYLGYSMSHVPTHYDGVQSCHHVSHTFQGLLWSSMLFNILTFTLSIVTCALVGFYKNHLMVAHRSITQRSVITTQTTTMMPPIHTIQPSMLYYASPPQVNLQLMPSGAPTGQPERAAAYNVLQGFDNPNFSHEHPPLYKP